MEFEGNRKHEETKEGEEEEHEATRQEKVFVFGDTPRKHVASKR